ncbi:MAG: SRPBCC family protein [Myxococcota bacterium]
MKAWLKVGLALVVAGIGLGVAGYAVGSTLPVEHSATVVFVVPAPPEAVEARVRDWASAPTWKPEVERVEDLGIVDGHQRFRECAWECIDLEILPGPTYTTRIVDHPDFGGTWTWRFAPSAAGTEVTITEDGVVPSPVFRLFMHYVFGVDANLRSTGEALRASFQQ